MKSLPFVIMGVVLMAIGFSAVFVPSFSIYITPALTFTWGLITLVEEGLKKNEN